MNYQTHTARDRFCTFEKISKKCEWYYHHEAAGSVPRSRPCLHLRMQVVLER